MGADMWEDKDSKRSMGFAQDGACVACSLGCDVMCDVSFWRCFWWFTGEVERDSGEPARVSVSVRNSNTGV